jgi:hypothetical protein
VEFRTIGESHLRISEARSPVSGAHFWGIDAKAEMGEVRLTKDIKPAVARLAFLRAIL